MRSRPTIRRRLAAVAIIPIAMVGSAATADAAPAVGGNSPFSLSASALIGQGGTTDLALGTTSTNPSTYPVPSSIKQLQLKSFDTSGNLLFTKNASDVPSPDGHAVVTRTDLTRGQPLKLHALAQTAQSKNTVVLEATATVKRRPDLTFVEVSAPTEVAPGQPFSVSAIVKELNGDVGGSGAVSILDGASPLDSIASLAVPAGGTQGGMLALQLDQPGTYNLTASISGVVPGEWDTTNNTASFTVTVVQGNKTMQYSSYYYKYNQDYNYDEFWDGPGEYEPNYQYKQQYGYEYFSSSWWTSDTVTPSGTLDLEISSESGVVEDVHLTDVTLTYDGWGSSYYTYLPGSALSVNVYTYPGSYGSYVSVWHNAGRYTYSYRYRDYFPNDWETYNYYCDYYYYYDYYCANFWNAQETLTVSLDLAAGGSHYGGTYTLGLYGYVSPWDYWYDYYYWYRYHQWGQYSYADGSAYGETTW